MTFAIAAAVCYRVRLVVMSFICPLDEAPPRHGSCHPNGWPYPSVKASVSRQGLDGRMAAGGGGG